jgi:uncharacterized protein
MKRNLSDQRIGVQILALLGFIFIGLIMVTIATALIVLSMNDSFSMSALENLDFTNPDNIALIRTILPVQTILLFGVPASTFAYFAYRNGNEYIGMRPVANISHIAIGIIAIVTSLYFVGLLAQWNKMIPMPQSWISTEKDYEILTKSLLTMDTIWQLGYNLIIIAFLPALCEEFLFRGCIQNMMIQQFTKKYATLAIIITGIIFGLIHGQMQTVLPRIFLGILLGCLYYWSNSIWVAIIAHFVNNGLQVVVAYLASNKIIGNDLFNDDTNVPLPYGLLSAGICFVLFFLIYKSKQIYQIFTTTVPLDLDAENINQ